jgi:hypothetical protein
LLHATTPKERVPSTATTPRRRFVMVPSCLQTPGSSEEPKVPKGPSGPLPGSAFHQPSHESPGEIPACHRPHFSVAGSSCVSPDLDDSLLDFVGTRPQSCRTISSGRPHPVLRARPLPYGPSDERPYSPGWLLSRVNFGMRVGIGDDEQASSSMASGRGGVGDRGVWKLDQECRAFYDNRPPFHDDGSSHYYHDRP